MGTLNGNAMIDPTNFRVGSGAFKFPGGVNDFVSSPSSASLNVGTGDFTIDAWIQINASDKSGVRTILDKRANDTTSTPTGYHLFLLNGFLGIQLADGTGLTNFIEPMVDVGDGAFHHVAATVARGSATGGTLYIDGVSVLIFDPTGRAGSLTNTANLRIGGHLSNPSSNYLGLIDEFDLYTRALSAAEIRAIASAGGLGKCCPTITLSPTSLPGAQLGTGYNQTITQTGGAGSVTWSVSVGTLPNNLTLNSTTGVLAGTPIMSGSFNFTIRATDINGCTGERTYTLAVGMSCTTITVSPTNPGLAGGTATVPYSRTFTQTGGTGTITWSNPGGGLPPGLTLAGGTGILSGTPTTSGFYSFIIRATDANNCTGERQYGLAIYNVTCTVTTPISIGQTINGQLTASDCDEVGPYADLYSFSATAGQQIFISLTSGSFNAYLFLLAPNGTLIAEDDDGGGGTNARIPAGSGLFTLPTTGTYKIYAISAFLGETGNYTLTLGTGGNGLQFYPLPAPVRLLDTRFGASPNACSQPNAPIAGQTSRTQPGRNICTIPANAQALTGNVTTVQSGGGFLTLYPSDAQQPTVASTNYGANEVVNNVFTVGLGADGAFKIFANNTTEVVVDVTGYYAPPGAGGLYFHPLPAPVRLLETRAGQAVGCVKPGVPLVGGADSLQTATTACTGIPAAARAIVGNATTVGPQAGGFLTIFPADAVRPLVASSNYNFAQVVNGPFSVGLTTGGQFKIYTTATTDLVVDVLGYYSPEANDANGAGLLFTPLPKPVRLLETRPNLPVGCFKPGVPLAGGSETPQPARGLCDGVTIPNNALGVVGNATVVFPQGAGFLTLWPSTAARPLVATSNYNPGDVGNRHFIVGLGNADGAFKMYSFATTHLVIDLSGYFAP